MKKDIFDADSASSFEQIGDVHLFFYLKILNGILIKDGIDWSDIEDRVFVDACDEASNSVGIDLTYPIDYNYISAVLNLNKDYDFSQKSPSKPIIRPIKSVYTFDYEEDRIEYITTVYQHIMVSYSKELVTKTIESMENEGAFEYYDGREVYRDNYDGETRDNKLISNSIKKIK